MAVTFASNALSMTIPFAGPQLALVFSYREFRRRGLGSAITGWALGVSAILSTAALALILVAGAIAGGVSVATALGLAGAIRATGSQVPWHGLLLAYAAGAAIGTTGITPGGFALVEATLTAALVASGLSAPAALAAVLAYRLISFWMIMIGGWILMMALTRARTGQGHLYLRAGGPAGPVSSASTAGGPVSSAGSGGPVSSGGPGGGSTGLVGPAGPLGPVAPATQPPGYVTPLQSPGNPLLRPSRGPPTWRSGRTTG